MGEITQNNNVVGERAGILKLSLIDMEIDSPLFFPHYFTAWIFSLRKGTTA